MTSNGKVTRGMAWKSALGVLGAGALLVYLFGSDLGAQGPRDGERRTVQGTVRALTTAPKGEVDGAELADGTLLHWPPHLADRFGAVVGKGDRVRATGRTETGPEGDTHFEVVSVTNLRTGKTARNDDRPPRRGQRARSREERLRNLEEQIDRLRAEVRSLRRER